MKTFRQFLNESGQLASLIGAIRDRGVEIDVYEKNGIIKISKIVVPKDMRNQGIGSSVMKKIAKYADETSQKIALTPDSAFGGNKNKLRAFYKRLGFVDNKGRNKDFSFMESMYREPSTK